DISAVFMGGPTACDARLALLIATASRTSSPLRDTTAFSAVSEAPNGVRPVKRRLARPSQKLRVLKTALMTDGELRLPTWRTLTPLSEEAAPVRSAPRSEALPESTPRNARWNTP